MHSMVHAQEIPRTAGASWGLLVVERDGKDVAKGYEEVQAPKCGHHHLFTRTLLLVCHSMPSN